MQRNEVPKHLQWKTTDLFESDDAWEQAFTAFENKYGNYDFSVFAGKLAEKETLLACLRCIDQVTREIEKIYLYANLRHHEDVRVSKNSASVAKVGALISKIFAEFAFVEPELTALSNEQLQAFIADNDFAEYNYRLQKIAKSKAHVLSAEEEKLLTLGSDVLGDFQSVFSMLNNANLNLPKASFQGEETQMSHGAYGVVMRSGTREERKEWFEKYYGAYINLIDAISQTYYSNVKADVFYKTVKKYDSCMQMAMAGEDVQPKVYENLLKATHDALPVMHEYIYCNNE